VQGTCAETIERAVVSDRAIREGAFAMRIRMTCLGRGVRTGLAAIVCLVAFGCEDETRKTGTLAQKVPGQEAGEKASMEAMKAMMQSKMKSKSSPKASRTAK
jgi:hypothetical protein